MNHAIAIVLAAGSSTRFGRNKLLLPFGPSPVVRVTVDRVLASSVDGLIVVTGHQHELVEAVLPVDTRLRVAHNPLHAQGEMLSSLQAGLRAAPADAQAALIVLGDLPLLQSRLLDHLICAHARGCGAVITPAFHGTRGHPVLFDRALWPELLELEAGRAPREVVRRHRGDAAQFMVADAAPLLDVDTPDAYARALLHAGLSENAIARVMQPTL